MRSSKLADENAKCRVEFERSYSYLRLVAACSKIAWTSVKVRKTKRLPLVLLRAQKGISEQALHWPWLVGSLRWDNWRTSFTTQHVSVVWAIEHFYKNKASHHKQRQFDCCFLSLFYFLSIISAFVTNMSFIEALLRLRICLFRFVFCRWESSKTCYFNTVLTVLLLTVANCEPYLLQTNSSFPLRLSESQGMFKLGQICQNSEAKIWKATYRHQLVLCSLIKHALSANQSAHYMETLL